MAQKKVLVASSDPDMLFFFRELGNRGFMVRETSMINVPLIAMIRGEGEERVFDIVLLEAMMPDDDRIPSLKASMDLCLEIRSQWQGPIIMFTAWDTVLENTIRAFNSNSSDSNNYLTDPFDFQRALEMIKKALGMSAPLQVVS